MRKVHSSQYHHSHHKMVKHERNLKEDSHEPCSHDKRRKKHKRHHCKDEEADNDEMYCKPRNGHIEGPAEHIREVIEVQGSSSEEEINSDNENSDKWEYEKHSVNKHDKNEKRLQEQYKKRCKSTSESSDDHHKELGNTAKRHRHHSSKSEHRVRKKEYNEKMVYKMKRRGQSPTNDVEVERKHRRLKEEEVRRQKTVVEEQRFESHRIKREPREERVKEEPLENRPERRSVNTSGRRESSWRNRSQRDREKSPEWGKGGNKATGNKSTKEKEKPSFTLSGKLAEDTNTYNGVVIKYSEPPEARVPKKRWRLYQFKGDEDLPTLYIHRQSAYLLGRDRKVVDIPIDHPSCSKQHAALQYRLVTYTRANGTTGKQIRLYIIDLESANGTFINNKKIEPKRYVQLMEKDVIKFGFSSREYVLLHEHSKGDISEENDT